GRSFDAAVPASVIVCPVPVALAVGLVVLPIVGDKVVQREAVVTGHEVHTLLRLAVLVSIHFRATDQAVGKACHRTGFTPAEAADPLFPTVSDETPDLVEPGRVPCLCDELRAGQ